MENTTKDEENQLKQIAKSSHRTSSLSQEQKTRVLMLNNLNDKTSPRLAQVQEAEDEEEEEEKEENEVMNKLGAFAIGLNIRLRSGNMPQNMQERALHYTISLLHHPKTSFPSPSILARALKKEFDSVYGPAWHCIVGKSFGSFVTHSPGGFLYFSIDSHNLFFLLFKTEVHLVAD